MLSLVVYISLVYQHNNWMVREGAGSETSISPESIQSIDLFYKTRMGTGKEKKNPEVKILGNYYLKKCNISHPEN